MRKDISNAIKAKTNLRAQTIGNNADPKLSLVVARKETLLDDFSFVERRRVRKTTQDSITDVAIAVSHPEAGRDDSEVYIVYIKDNHMYMRHSAISAEIQDIDWEIVDIGVPSALKCDVAFDSIKVTNRRGISEYVTLRKPIVFYVHSTTMYCIIDGETQELGSFGVKDISARMTPLGLALFYAKMDSVYYMLYTNGEWGEETSVNISFSGTIDGISAFPTLQGFGIQIYSDGKIYYSIGDENLSNWSALMTIDSATGTGAICEFYDGTHEAFFDADTEASTGKSGGFMYAEQSEGLNPWNFQAGKRLTKSRYSVIEFDHTNQGTVYFATLKHGDYDRIYFFRYAYMRDVSSYTYSVEQRFHVDNPIAQINAVLMNIDDSLYTSEATLFAPSSIMQLGIQYGNSDIVPMGFAYIDQATIEAGGDQVNLSGRNKTGAYLKDQTFNEDTVLVNTPELMVEQIMEIFGLEDDYFCDDSANGTFENPNIITLEVKAKTTGLEAMQTLNNMLSQDAAGKQWRFEETYNGTIVVGYDEFRAGYVPKNYYTFNGRNDVFAKTVDRCISGVYNKVHVVGVTPKGKEIQYTYPVTNFRFWDVGENRIYHADKIEGITKSELKKYGKALANQLQYIGRVIEYQMNLKPQLLIGDVATITETNMDDGEEGYITEITHTMGVDGYFTEFTVTSGGNITDVLYTPPVTRSVPESEERAYVADKSVNGTNRNRSLVDFFGQGGAGANISSNTTIIQGESVNLPELIRNIGFRLLDEPTNVQVQYDEDDNEVKIKYTDPNDITTFAPVPVDWAGTIIVRNENGAPLHPWDGTILNDSTTRDEYKNDWFVDDNNIQRGGLYFYGIFPYHIALDDNDHPIKYYRWTKVVSVNTGLDLKPAIITNLEVDGVNVTVSFEIPALKNGSYANITLVAKKGGTPLSVDDGDEFITLTDSDTSAEVSGLDELSHYYFVIFSEDDQGNTAVSDPAECATEENPAPPPEYEFILKTNDLCSGANNWLQNDEIHVTGDGGYWCDFPNGRRAYTLISDDFYTPGAHSNGTLGRYTFYCANSIMTIRLTTQSGGTVSAEYSESTMMADPKNYVTNQFYQYDTLQFPIIIFWSSRPSLDVTDGEPFTPSISYKQLSFDDMLTALQYVYKHYANINLYVNGHKWVSVE